MNCCNDFGVCDGGLGCPCRRGDAQPAQVTRVKASAPAPEAGNIWFAEPEPLEPLSRGELLAVWGTVLVLTLTSAVLMALGASYAWTRWLA